MALVYNNRSIKTEKNHEKQMTSSTTSSLTSPSDSGVQLLDSESDITVSESDRKDNNQFSKSVPNYFNKLDKNEKNVLNKSLSDEVFEIESIKDDIMNISLNSYELLDYTLQNKLLDQMHVSMSEEVNENLPQNNAEVVPEEQIVFRRQRKKKSKSDTPKKRVSFHEDILNSTKIDDIHIEHGFITHESTNHSWRDVVKGRYSWAAEGDPFYEKPDLLQTQRFSTSSSSTGSVSSSIDEDSDETKPVLMKPKSSCLKKKSSRKHIDTNIVEEEISKKRRSDSNLLDSNIFGSLKNILSFSTSVPLAERGVPEGQEDIAYSLDRPFKGIEPKAALKSQLKLTASEGFYANYSAQAVPANVIVCDSNVYEHKGISYSYEYDKFQKSFSQQQQQPKESSSVYQKFFNEFNFFRRKAKQMKSQLDVITKNDSIEEVQEVEVKSTKSSSKIDWSDNDTISEFSDNINGKHLNSPKKRPKNHYSVSSFRNDSESAKLSCLKPASSKTSLINRFLRNVTMKKMMDAKNQIRKEDCRKYMDLYVKNFKFEYKGKDSFDDDLENEICKGQELRNRNQETSDPKFVGILKKEVFRNELERLLKTFPVRSAYTTNGESKPLLLILSNSTLYISGTRSNTFINHFVLPYTELNTILIGPNAQTIHLSNYDKDMQCIITTGCSQITSDLIGRIEIAMRQDSSRPRLAAVKYLGMRDMINLRRAICKQTSVDKEEDYYYYSIVNIQDFTSDIPEVTPIGPNREGPLMFKFTNTESRWETAYFILKAGVLYMLSSASQRVPMRVFPLINGACQGARRVFNSPRPHTFQLIVESQSIYLAAPDEYVASDWLQSLVHAASGGYYSKDNLATQSCSLMMTSEHILAVREAFPCTILSLLPGKGQHQPIKGPQVLSCATIVDLVSFRLPSAEQSWCILEFSCREVHECSGDWILYFATNVELENFISTLEVLWDFNNETDDSFPLTTIPETDPLSKKCVDIYTSLKHLWPTNSVHLQFL